MNMLSFYLGNTFTVDITDTDIFKARTDFDIKYTDVNTGNEETLPICKDEYFRIDDAPEEVKSQLRNMVKHNFAYKYETPKVAPVVILSEIEQLEEQIEKVADITAKDLLEKVLESSSKDYDSSITIPDMLDGKISKQSEVIKEAVQLVKELKEEKPVKSKLDLFREKRVKKSETKLDKFKRKRDARKQ